MVQLVLLQPVAMHPWDAAQMMVHGPEQSTRHSPELRQVTWEPGPTSAEQSPELWQSTVQVEPQLWTQDWELLQVSVQSLAHCWLQGALPLQTQLPPSQKQVPPPPSVLQAAGPPRPVQLQPLHRTARRHGRTMRIELLQKLRGGTAGPCTA